MKLVLILLTTSIIGIASLNILSCVILAIIDYFLNDEE